jgi:hypothetical protein
MPTAKSTTSAKTYFSRNKKFRAVSATSPHIPPYLKLMGSISVRVAFASNGEMICLGTNSDNSCRSYAAQERIL